MDMHPNLKRMIEGAQRSEGYFITVTKLSNGRIFTEWFTHRFERSDMYPALDQARKMIKSEVEDYSTKSEK